MELQKQRESELCSVSSVGVIRTAIMIDFVPVPTCTPLPFLHLLLAATQSALWLLIHMHYAGRARTLFVPFPAKTAHCSIQNGIYCIDPVAFNQMQD